MDISNNTIIDKNQKRKLKNKLYYEKKKLNKVDISNNTIVNEIDKDTQREKFIKEYCEIERYINILSDLNF